MHEPYLLVQWLSFFPPHLWGIETVGEDIGEKWKEFGYGNVIQVTLDVDQIENLKSYAPIYYKKKHIGYTKNGVQVLCIPSKQLFGQFYRFQYWNATKRAIYAYLHETVRDQKTVCVSHGRFFYSSLKACEWAKKEKIPWTHIEHGNEISPWDANANILQILDTTQWKTILTTADTVLTISKKTSHQIRNVATREVHTWYRGIDTPQKHFGKFKTPYFVYAGRLVSSKWVADLLEVYNQAHFEIPLMIIGGGEEKSRLQELAEENRNIFFQDAMTREDFLEFLQKNTVIFVNPSYMEGMPTTVIEALATGNIVVATDVGGTSEISSKKDLLLYTPWDIQALKKWLDIASSEYEHRMWVSKQHVLDVFSREKNIRRLYEYTTQKF